jgi:putative ABC transport system permease protein
MLKDLPFDVRHALRALRRNPSFAAVSLLTLGLGIGASSAIFSVVNGILLRSLPFPEADRLVSLCETMPDAAGRCVTASTPNVADWAERSRSFQGIGVFRWWGHVMETPHGAENLNSLIATPDFFDVMEYRPAAGRLFLPEDQQEGNRRVAVLDHDFWVSRFGGDPAVLGSTLTLEGEPFHVIGVLGSGQKPPAMSGERGADLWVPLHFDPRDNQRRNWRGFYAVGRLAPGASLEVARQEILAIRQGLTEEHPADNAEWGLELATLKDRVVGRVRTTLLAFLGAVGLLLLITCANIANLILARLSGREAELALRAALGAGTTRLARLLLHEGLLLAFLGSGLGLALAWGGTRLFLALAPSGIPRLGEVGLDWVVVAFTLGLAALATLLFGLAPLLRVSRMDTMEALRRSRHGRPGGPPGGMNGTLVVAEFALAVTLLVGAGLLTRSFAAFFRWEPGIDREHLLVVANTTSTGAYSTREALLALYRTLDGALLSIPGVRSVARTSAGPLFGGWEPDQVRPAERAGSTGEGRQARWYDISPGYFQTMSVPLLRGRDFTHADGPESAPVVIVNQTLADHLWPGEDPLGRSLWLDLHGESRQVVGVVGDVPPLDPDAPVEPEMFWPQAQYIRPFTHFVLRTQGDPGTVRGLVADRIRKVDPNLQPGPVRSYDELLARQLVQPRFTMLLIAMFAAVALALAAIGIYGVVSRAVVARTREIGIRLALGASPGRVVGQVVAGSMALAGAGVGVGLILALGLSRLIRSLLHGVAPTDPVTYGLVACGLLAVALLAGLVPALTAGRLEPMRSLRQE